MAKAGTVWVDVRADTKGFAADLSRAAQGATRSLGGIAASGAKTVFGDIAQTAGVAALGVAGIGIAAVKTSMEFDAAMSVVKAVSGATGDELSDLREAALDAGASTVFSATEAAEAQQELVRAGVSVSDVMGGALVGSLGLAAAGQLQLKDAAEIAAQAMNIFKLEGDDVGYVADVLAAGANKSAADVSQLGWSLRMGGLMASQMGVGLEETIGIFSMFADNALIGSDAGTSFKVMLQRLTPATGPAQSAMEELGLSFFDAEGNFVGLEESAQRLQDSMKGLTEEQRSAAMEVIFGSDGVRAANILYNEGAAGVREYTEAVSDEGAAVRMAAENLNNLKGDIEEFRGANETALIRIGDLFDGFNRNVVQSATGFVNVFNDFAGTPTWDAIERNIRRLSGNAGSLFEGLADDLDQFLAGISPQDVNRAFARIEDAVAKARSAVEGLEPVIGGVSIAFSTMALQSLPLLNLFVPAISPITGLLGGLVLGSEAGRDALADLGEKAAELAGSIGPGLGAALADLSGELSDGLASVLRDVGGAAIEAAEIVGPVLSDAISQLAPPLGDLLEAGGELVAEVLPTLAHLAGDVIPPAADAMAGVLGLAADAAGLLAENSWLLAPALGAIVALKFGDHISGWAGKIGDIAGAAATSAGDFKTYFGVLREEGATVGQALKGAANESAGLGGALGGLNPAVAGVTAAVTLGVFAYQNYADNKERVRQITDGLVDALDEEIGKFREMTREQARKTFADKDALDAQNQLGISLADLTETSALYGDEVGRLDGLFEASGGNMEVFRRSIEKLPGPVREIGEGIAGLVDSDAISMGEAARFFDALDELAQGSAASMKGAKTEFESLAREAAESGEITAGQLDTFLKQLSEAKTPAEVNEAFQYLSGLLGGVGDAASSAEADIQRLNKALEDLMGVERDVDQATRDLNDAIQGTLESFGRNGKGIDQNTDAGRRNADAIKRMVEAAEDLAEAQARTDTTGKASSETFQQLQQDLFAMKEAGLITATEYQHLLDLYDLTPEEIETRIAADISEAEANLETIKKELLATPGVTEEMKAWIEAANTPEALVAAAREIDFVARNRKATIDVDTSPSPLIIEKTLQTWAKGLPAGKTIDSWKKPGRRASGGPIWPGTWLVGEEGPELLHLGSGAAGRVDNARTTERVLSDAKSQTGGEFSDALLEEFRLLRAELAAVANAPKVVAQYHQVERAPDPDDLSRKLNRTRLGAF